MSFPQIINQLDKFFDKSAKNKWYDNTSNYIIEVFSLIGQLSAGTKHNLRNYIMKCIDKDPSHLVTGTYAFMNFEDRPKNTIMVISDSHGVPELLLNYAPSRQVIVIGSNPSAISFTLVNKILAIEDTLFLYASGKSLIESLICTQKNDHYLNNIVFKLQHLIKPSKSNDLIKVIVVDADQPTETERIPLLEQISSYYEYNLSLSEMNRLVTQKPHAIAYLNDQPAGFARANSVSPSHAVIGGVHTRQQMRHQGVATIMTYHLAARLSTMNRIVSLETDVGNFPARRAYSNIGFTEVGNALFLERGLSRIKDDILGDRDY